MKRLFYLAALLSIVLVSCNSFRKTKSGMLYKIISNGQGQKLENGNFFEIQTDYFYKDSHTDTVLFRSSDRGNQIIKLDSISIPADYFSILSKLRLGDSVVIKTSIDSILKSGGSGIPTFFKKGEFLVTTYKVVNIFADEKQAKNAQEKIITVAKQKDSVRRELQHAKDDKIIADYLAKNKITAVKAPKGTYVQIIEPGTGDLIDTGKVAKVKYTGWSMSTGKAFDSNIDSTFRHTDLLTVYLNPPRMIPGWLDALPLLRKGAKAKLFIPSVLGYGEAGSGQAISPNENLIFEVQIADVVTVAQEKAAEKAEADKRMAMQKHSLDSMRMAMKLDSIKKGIKK